MVFCCCYWLCLALAIRYVGSLRDLGLFSKSIRSLSCSRVVLVFRVNRQLEHLKSRSKASDPTNPRTSESKHESLI